MQNHVHFHASKTKESPLCLILIKLCLIFNPEIFPECQHYSISYDYSVTVTVAWPNFQNVLEHPTSVPHASSLKWPSMSVLPKMSVHLNNRTILSIVQKIITIRDENIFLQMIIHFRDEIYYHQKGPWKKSKIHVKMVDLLYSKYF